MNPIASISGDRTARDRSVLLRSRAVRRGTFTLLALVFLAVTLLFRHQQSDEGSYLRFAGHLAGLHGDGRSLDLWFGPGLPLVLAPFAYFHIGLEAMRVLFGPVVLFLAVLLFYELLKLRVQPTAAFAGAVGLGLYFPFYILLPSLHSEILSVLLMVSFMYSFTRFSDARGPTHLFLASASLGYLALTRPVFGWVLAICLIISVAWWQLKRRDHLKRISIVYALALALCLPWLAYTYSVTHKPFYWASSGGLSLYWMAAPYPGHLGDWHSTGTALTDTRYAADRPEFLKIRGLTTIQMDQALRRDAIRLIRKHPHAYMRHVADNVARLWLNMPFSFTSQKLTSVFYIAPNMLLLFAFSASVCVLWLRRRRLPAEVEPFFVLLLFGVAIQSLLSAYPRMLAPLVPLLIWTVTFTVDRYVKLTPGPDS